MELVHEINSEIHKALSSTGDAGKKLKYDSDISTLNIFFNYDGCTGDGDKESARKQNYSRRTF